MSEYLSKSVVRKRFLCAIRMFDAQHFTRRFKLQLGGLTQCISDRNQLQALVVVVRGALSRAVLKLLNLCVVVPPEEFRLVVGIDDGVYQTVIVVEILGALV